MISQKITPPIDQIAPYIIQSIQSGKKVKLAVTGNSMYPLFRDRRDTVVLAPFETLKKRDVIFYRRSNGQYVLHRILKKKGDNLTIAGDNETKKEYNVKVSDAIAVMESFERYQKSHSAGDLWYRVYAFFWVSVFPLRKYCKPLLHIGAKIFKSVKRGSD